MRKLLICLAIGAVLKPLPANALTARNIEIESRRSNAELLAASSVSDLSEAVKETSIRARRFRACRIQRKTGIPPTMCYGLSKSITELDSLCLKLSRTAVRIPKPDESTSEVCRAALAKRNADLAYAMP